MSLFAGFVGGLFDGMDWRESRDDRRTQRKREAVRESWAQEDRTHTLSERERVAREREQARARGAAARARAEQTRVEDLAALNESVDVLQGLGRSAPAQGAGQYPEPISIRDNIAPRAGGNATAAGATVLPAETRQRPAVSPQRSNRDNKTDDPRPAADPAPLSSRSMSLIDANSPIPSEASVQREAARRQAVSPMPGATNQGFAPAPQSAGTEIDDIAAGLAALPAPSPAPRAQVMATQANRTVPAAREAAARPAPAPAPQPATPADQYSERAQGIARVIPDALSRVGRGAVSLLGSAAETQGRRALAEQALNQDTAGIAIAATGAPGAGAASMRRADELRRLAARPGQTQGTSLGAVTLPPQAGSALEPAAPVAPTRAQMNYGTPMVEPAMPPRAGGVRPEVRQQAQATPDQAPQTQSGTPMASVQQVARQAISIAPQAGRGGANTREVRERAAETFVQQYRQQTMLPIVERLIRTGRVSEARQMQGFFDDLRVQDGMRSWARAIHAYSVNDTEGMVEALSEAYNNEAYYADGLSVERAEPVPNEDGEVIGADITFRDNESGRTFTQQIRGINDLVAVGIGTLSPEAAFEHMLGLTLGRDAPEPQRISAGDMVRVRAQAQSEVTQDGAREATQEEIDARVRAILQGAGMSASGLGARPVPVMP